LKKPQVITALQVIAALICLCMAILIVNGRAAGLEASTDLPGKSIRNTAEAQILRQAPDQPYDVYLPILYRWETTPMVTLTSASTGDANGNDQTLFLPGDSVRYTAGGRNNYPINVSVTLRWEQENPCGITMVFSQTLSLPPGDWQRTTTSTIPSCPGIYTSTARVSNSAQTYSLAILDVVNPPSIVQTNNQQGFDRCHLGSVSQMQTWWDSSPYWVYNIYLGGSMFYCDDEIPDAFWVHQVAGQGWKFILTWVGPQAPCSVFREKMSSNTSTARQQGRTEAAAAAAAASRIGFLGNRVIYYDLEAYGSSATSECRAAVAAFIRGWTERLHELGYLAGGYGSPVTSHIDEWASNNPPPDFIWIAHWLTPAQYRADATVRSSYLSDSLWSNHQRIRQYAGGHNETWGGVTLDMDSNVLDGAITAIPLAAAALAEAQTPVEQQATIPAIRQMQVLSQDHGWILQGERLLVTQDGGGNWQDITPPNPQDEPMLGAQMLDLQQGWVVRQSVTVDELTILRTTNGGTTWEASSLQLTPSPLDGSPVAEATLDFLDGNTGWLALRLQSGSSFSLGRLFATQDGGFSWVERSLPLGEAVHFSDALRGWVAGGPGGDQRYRTEDGGYTWIAEDFGGVETLPLPTKLNGSPVLQQASAGSTHWIVVADGMCSGDKSVVGESVLCYQRSSLYRSTDGGSSWSEITPLTQ
jgi:photosystem II stability/assembly factor-like uncharacterized protein